MPTYHTFQLVSVRETKDLVEVALIFPLELHEIKWFFTSRCVRPKSLASNIVIYSYMCKKKICCFIETIKLSRDLLCTYNYMADNTPVLFCGPGVRQGGRRLSYL